MTTRHSASIIAKYFILKNDQESKGLTNKKLQKLLYYSQAWSLVLRNKKLFKENIEAWVHGPAVPKVYLKYRKFGHEEIEIQVEPKVLQDLSEDEIELLDSVWKVYGKYDADYLELLTHNETPWQKARKGHRPYEASTNVISTRTMKDFYGKKLKEAKEKGSKKAT